MKTIFTVATMLLAIIYSNLSQGGNSIYGSISHVYDGDTIRIGTHKVRLWGLHVPELNTQNGKDAKRFLQNYILGVDVSCTLTGAKSYDRSIGKCFVGDVDIAIVVIMNGYGRDCPRYSGHAYRQFETIDVQAWPLPSYCGVK